MAIMTLILNETEQQVLREALTEYYHDHSKTVLARTTSPSAMFFHETVKSMKETITDFILSHN